MMTVMYGLIVKNCMVTIDWMSMTMMSMIMSYSADRWKMDNDNDDRDAIGRVPRA